MKNKIVGLLVVFLFSDVTYSHDTTHIHPLITKRISTLFRIIDQNSTSYKDFYELNTGIDLEITRADGKTVTGEQLKYWGTDYDEGRKFISNEEISELGDDQISNFRRYNNVIDGVVQEDVPFWKVLNHFYQADSGIGLTVTNGAPSSFTSMIYFNQAIQWFGGYTEAAKHKAFFVFGQALHHVEDMSSPAHVHNDPHLVLDHTEKDDYEGHYLPLQKSEPT